MSDGIITALQSQLDDVAEALGAGRMKASDGYHGTAVRDVLRELERWRHGNTIEGDFVCPNELAAGDYDAKHMRLIEERDAALSRAVAAEEMMARQARHITILVMDQRRQLPADVLKDIADSHRERDEARAGYLKESELATAMLDEVDRLRRLLSQTQDEERKRCETIAECDALIAALRSQLADAGNK